MGKPTVRRLCISSGAASEEEFWRLLRDASHRELVGVLRREGVHWSPCVPAGQGTTTSRSLRGIRARMVFNCLENEGGREGPYRMGCLLEMSTSWLCTAPEP